MKQAIFYMAMVFAVFIAKDAQAQTTSSSAPKTSSTARSMATEGEKVWVLVNHIKADKRQQFERFIHEVFWPMAAKLSPEDQRVFKQTRVLHPTAAEADGTYSYIFIMDPLIEGGNYDIESLLKKMYGEQKGAEHYRMLEETEARVQTQYLMTQSRY